ncbi:MAG: UDP-glucose 4-epimerase GalE [Helicobacter apodemus]|nr:UDP-glucose 4-epimerase GalE [Helicobacter apodemus]
MKVYLFTGAAGYIGSHTAYAFLRSCDCKIIILDNLSTGFIENIFFLQWSFSNRVEFIQGNFGDRVLLESIFKQYSCKAVIHFAGSLIVAESVQKPLMYFYNNVANTLILLEAMQKFNIHRFIFSSTAAVYGEPTQKDCIAESAITYPINAYGESKLMVEKILSHFEVASSEFRSVILRYFNVAGALMDSPKLGQRTKDATHLIKIACECAVGKRKEMGIFGDDYPTYDGTCIRDYIHIDDLANAHFEALKTLEQTSRSQIFNVGYGKGFSVKEVIECVKAVSGVDFVVRIQPRRAGDPAVLVSDNKKILSSTQWRPQYANLEIICKSAYLWEKSLI